MAEETKKGEGDILKEIRGKLEEMEDLQLVNKLDIINVKNELDRASLSEGSAADTTDRIAEMRSLLEDSDKIKKAEKLVDELEKLKEELKTLRAAAPGPEGGEGGIMDELKSLRSRIAGMEKEPAKKTTKRKEGPRNDELEELRERVKKLESSGPSGAAVPDALRKEIQSLKRKVSGLSAVGGKKAPPKGMIEKIGRIDEIAQEMEELREDVRKQRAAAKSMKAPKAAEASHEVPEDIMDRIRLIEAALGGDEEYKPRKSVKEIPQKGLQKKLKSIEEKVAGLEEKLSESGKESGREKKRVKGDAPPVVGELKSIVEGLKRSLEEQGKDIVDLKKDKSIALALERIDGLKKEVGSVKSHMVELEQDAASIGMAPDALEELKKFKGEFPVEEIHGLKGKVDKLEKNLSKLSVLASGLKPIELPKESSSKGKKVHDLDSRVRELEKVVKEGVSPEKVRELEKKMEELRDWLPEYVANDTKHRMDDFMVEVKRKVKEVDALKDEIIENTIEQLLAQPATISKLLGDRIRNKIDELEKAVSRMKSNLEPAEAKMETSIRQTGSLQKEVEKLSNRIEALDRKFSDETGSLSIDLKALNSRIGSMGTAVKGVRETGIPGASRDIEILKTKTDWLESTLHKLDLSEIHERLDELEKRISRSSGYSPMVIE